MSEKNNGLHLVPRSQHSDSLHALRTTLPAQNVLFPVGGADLLVFITFSSISDGDFLESINLLQPRIVLDIRRFPRFDTGRLNRRLAFEQFERAHARYVDLLWSDDGGSDESNSFASAELASCKGPVMILLEAKQTAQNLVTTLTKEISCKSRKPWEVIQIPASESQTTSVHWISGSSSI